MGATTFLFDPVVVHAAAAAMGIILIVGALGKLRDLELFRYAVENYGLLGSTASALVARVLPAVELLAGLALILETTRLLGVLLGLAVMALVTGAVAINLLRGMGRIECGCGTGGQRISWGLVGRNLFLSAALLLAAADELPRSLGAIDYFSVAGAILALLVLYASANQLLANQPLLKELQS
ncbi:MauE/DoxX family redox-associated membrane protein [uncultured Dechloromonas sp.]|uniref:MauE/DoxX family redox-associated membrane protein n=1 Tax=uncultured Dechloromonas sp. TaxID=171719 RepID=UPI0025FFEC0D|nr:MauE/DoxX family redox-associated membrane protein [uncultured Dechloromonas sp.]